VAVKGGKETMMMRRKGELPQAYYTTNLKQD